MQLWPMELVLASEQVFPAVIVVAAAVVVEQALVLQSTVSDTCTHKLRGIKPQLDTINTEKVCIY